MPRLGASQCYGQQEGSSWLESHGKYLCTITRIQWCFRRGCDDSITVAFINGAIGTVRCSALGLHRRNLCRIRPANWHPHTDHNGMDSRPRILWRGNGGSLGHSLDRSSRLCRARILGLCASSKFKARADTFVVSTIMCRLGLGGSSDFDHYLGSACLINDVPQMKQPGLVQECGPFRKAMPLPRQALRYFCEGT